MVNIDSCKKIPLLRMVPISFFVNQIIKVHTQIKTSRGGLDRKSVCQILGMSTTGIVWNIHESCQEDKKDWYKSTCPFSIHQRGVDIIFKEGPSTWSMAKIKKKNAYQKVGNLIMKKAGKNNVIKIGK